MERKVLRLALALSGKGAMVGAAAEGTDMYAVGVVDGAGFSGHNIPDSERVEFNTDFVTRGG